MKLEFAISNIHVDGVRHPEADIEILLGYVCDFMVRVDGKEVFSEVEFPLLEFASEVATWLASGRQGDFNYESMDSVVKGLVYFRTDGADGWEVGSALSPGCDATAVADGEVEQRLRDFVETVRLIFDSIGLDVSRFLET